MKTIATLLLLPLFSISTHAADESLGDLKLLNGTELRDVRLLKVEPDGLRVEHRSGVGKLRLEDLPADLAGRFHLSAQEATAWRKQEKARVDAVADAQRRADVRALMEESKASQEAQAGRARMDIFDQAGASTANYAFLDEQVRRQIQLWKAADRPDLASRFEEDRDLLKKQEIARPSAIADARRDAMTQRLAQLEAETAVARNQPAPTTTTTIIVDSPDPFLPRQDYSYPNYWPVSPVYVPAPVYNPCPPLVVSPPILLPQRQTSNMGNPIQGDHLQLRR